MIIVPGSIPIRPECRDQALELAKQMATASRNEQGCMSYEFYVGLADPDTLMLFQEWESMEALMGHFDTDLWMIFYSAYLIWFRVRSLRGAMRCRLWRKKNRLRWLLPSRSFTKGCGRAHFRGYGLSFSSASSSRRLRKIPQYIHLGPRQKTSLPMPPKTAARHL